MLSFYLLIFYFVLTYFELPMKYPFLRPFQLETILFFLMMVLIVSNKKEKPENDAIRHFILFFIAIVMSIPLAFDWSIALNTTTLWLKTSFVFFIYIVNIVDDEKKLNTILIVYMACVLLICFPPLWDALHGKFANLGAYNVLRAADARSNIYGNANTLGMLAVSTLPFSYNYFRYCHERGRNLLKYVMLSYSLMLALLIIFTASRAAFLGLVLFGFLVIMRSKNKFRMVAILMTLFIVSMGAFGTQYRTRLLSILGIFSESTTSIDGSMRDRKAMIKKGVELFIKRPITGYGVGCYAVARGSVFRDTPRPAHTMYALLMAELGLVGIVALFLLIRSTFRNLKSAKEMMHRLKMEKELLYYQTLMIYDYFIIRLFVAFMAISLYTNYWAMAAAFSVVIHRLCLKFKNAERTV